eukprot:g2404.t1
MQTRRKRRKARPTTSKIPKTKAPRNQKNTITDDDESKGDKPVETPVADVDDEGDEDEDAPEAVSFSSAAAHFENEKAIARQRASELRQREKEKKRKSREWRKKQKETTVDLDEDDLPEELLGQLEEEASKEVLHDRKTFDSDDEEDSEEEEEEEEGMESYAKSRLGQRVVQKGDIRLVVNSRVNDTVNKSGTFHARDNLLVGESTGFHRRTQTNRNATGESPSAFLKRRLQSQKKRVDTLAFLSESSRGASLHVKVKPLKKHNKNNREQQRRTITTRSRKGKKKKRKRA